MPVDAPQRPPSPGGPRLNRGDLLVALAREAIAGALEVPAPDPPGEGAAWLGERGATFVTLTVDGALRGCIGSVEAYRPLGDDVRANAVAAALRDPRFPPLARHELDRIRIGVSLLSPLEPLPWIDEAEARRRLRRGVDWVVLEVGRRRATFLPQVLEQLPTPAAFLGALKRKADLPEDFWGPEVRLYRYTVTKYEEGAETRREVA
jgi:AmmeMemoRadiSam system protein A